MDLYGLIGKTLKHSFSQKYFREKFKNQAVNADYLNFELSEIESFANVFEQHSNIRGLNVTIPYKQAIIPLLDDLSEEALAIGAVNTIKVENTELGQKLVGYNTDCYGFKKSLEPHIRAVHTKALILGTGGASKAVAYTLDQLNIAYTFVSRTSNGNTLQYEELTEALISNSKLIINTTPLGMYPKLDDCPTIPYSAITAKHVLYDLIYNPQETLFLNKGKKKGATVINGAAMLQLQAEKAWQIWNT